MAGERRALRPLGGVIKMAVLMTTLWTPLGPQETSERLPRDVQKTPRWRQDPPRSPKIPA
eukprot:532230-Karenia_brevis.AAC.1